MASSVEKIHILSAQLKDSPDTNTYNLVNGWLAQVRGDEVAFSINEAGRTHRLRVNMAVGLLGEPPSEEIIDSLHASLSIFVSGERLTATELLPDCVTDEEFTAQLAAIVNHKAPRVFAGKIFKALWTNLRLYYFDEMYSSGKPPAFVPFGYYKQQLPRRRIKTNRFLTHQLVELLSTFSSEADYQSIGLQTHDLAEISIHYIQRACKQILEKQHD